MHETLAALGPAPAAESALLGASGPPAPAPVPGSASVQSQDGPLLDAEKLDAYRVAREFQVLASSLVPRTERVLWDQLDRASVSVVLCIAEGAGRRSRRDKARFYTMARGSAMESAAIVDLLLLRGLALSLDCRRGRSLLVRIVQMLTKLDRSLR